MSLSASDTQHDPGGPIVGVFRSSPQHDRQAWLVHGVLFVLTLFCATVFPALFFGWIPLELLGGAHLLPALLLGLREGLKFSIPLLVILTSHEMGHYLACRKHQLDPTLPFFIPFPFPVGFGTLGAVIRVKEPIRNKTQLIEIGAAGPIAGFVALLPFLIYGLWASAVTEIPNGAGLIWFGEPLIFRAFSALLHPDLPPGFYLDLHPAGWAAWCGLLVTLLNMLPFGQLDGGHVSYALGGVLHRRVVWWLLIVLAGLGFLWPGWWLWVAIALLLGVEHPPVLDEAEPLDRRQRLLGWIALLVFALSFMSTPIRI